MFSSTQRPGISWNNNNLPVGNTANISFRRVKCKIPSACSLLNLSTPSDVFKTFSTAFGKLSLSANRELKQRRRRQQRQRERHKTIGLINEQNQSLCTCVYILVHFFPVLWKLTIFHVFWRT